MAGDVGGGVRRPKGLRLNVYERALTEPRIKRVARKLGISEYDVLGRLNHLWMLCYQRRSEMVDYIDADIATGELPGFLECVISEQLADRLDEHNIRVRGAEDAIDQLLHSEHISDMQADKGRKSGASRRLMSDALRTQTAVQQGFAFGSNHSSTVVEPISNCLSVPERGTSPTTDALLPSGSAHSGQTTGGTSGHGGGAPPSTKTPHGVAGAHVEPTGKRYPEPPDEAVTLAELLLTLVTGNNPSGRLARSADRLKASTLVRWADTIRKLHQIDGMEWGAIEAMIRWCQRDDFWRGNILGADNLREHWDRMAQQRNRKPGGRHPNEPRPGPTELARREVEALERATNVPKAKP